MSTALIIALIVVAALICPAMMWWQNRRGYGAICCGSRPAKDPPDELETLRERQQELADEITTLEESRK